MINFNNKNTMKTLGFTLLIALLTLQSYSQTKNFIDQPYLETTAVVDTLVIPDRIYLSILITEADTKGRTSVEELENRMNDKLKALGIDTKKQLSLSDVASNFKKYFLRSKDVLKNKAYTLIVYDAVTAGKVIVGLESIEISNVQLTKTEYSKMEQMQMELKQKAVAKAKLQAESLLKPLNQNLGKAIYISDMNYNIYRSDVAEFKVRNMAAGEPAPIDIEFEKIKIESRINITFAIE
jgi:uncharacterized protein YggE